MIFFTKEWANGNLGDFLCESISNLYDQNLEMLLSNAPQEILKLSGLPINDFNIESVEKNENEITMRIFLSPNDTKLSYKHGQFVCREISEIGQLTGKELRYDELYFDEVIGQYVHNFICVDNFEFGITFSSVDIK